MLSRKHSRFSSRFLFLKGATLLCLFSLPLMAFEDGENQRTGIEYTYSPYEKSDPFNPALTFRAEPKSLDPLQSVPLDSIIVVATLVGQNSSALVQLALPAMSAKPLHFTVRVGDRLGSELGTIIAIYKDRLVVRQQIQGRFDDPNQRFQDVTLQLRRAAEQKAAELTTESSAGGNHEPKNITEALTQDVLPPNPKKFGASPIKGARRIQIFGSGSADVEGRRELPFSDDMSIKESSGSSLPETTSSFSSSSSVPPPSQAPTSYTEGPFSIERHSRGTNP